MPLAQVLHFLYDRDPLRLGGRSFSPLNNRQPSPDANAKIEVHPDMLMKTKGRPQKHGNPVLPQAGCAEEKKNSEDPRMFMKTKRLINHSYQCLADFALALYRVSSSK